MNKKFYIADTHFGHENVIRFDNRPFKSIEEHDQTLINNWNSVVRKEDEVYIVGDFCYKNSKPVSYYTKQLNGHLHLIWGNHDKRNEEYATCFETTQDIMKISDTIYGEKKKVILCHYWMPFAGRNKIILYGHTHVGDEYELEVKLKEELLLNDYPLNAYNVGCMHLDYYPKTLEEICNQ